jgi:hypothetical protein
MRILQRVPSSLRRPAVRAAESLLEPSGGCGVVAVGIDVKRREGRSLGYSTLVAYVERKSPEPIHPVPAVEFEHDGEAYRVVPDVVAVGAPRLNSGGSPIWTGLHPGSCIEVRYGGGGVERGAVAALLGDGQPTHLLTAGHLFAPHLINMPVYASSGAAMSPFVVGRLVANLLDSPPGTTLDVAAVALDQAGIQLAQASQVGPRLHDVVPTMIAGGRLAQAFLSTRHSYSAPPVRVRRTEYTAVLWAPRRGAYIRVRDPVRSDHAITTGGDSGTILMTTEERRRAIGICSGSFSGESIFEPLALALAQLSAHLARPLTLWNRNS